MWPKQALVHQNKWRWGPLTIHTWGGTLLPCVVEPSYKKPFRIYR